MSSQLLTSLGRLFTTFLKGRGFTIGVRDIMCVNKVRVMLHADLSMHFFQLFCCQGLDF